MESAQGQPANQKSSKPALFSSRMNGLFKCYFIRFCTKTQKQPLLSAETLTSHHVPAEQDPDGGDERAEHHHEADEQPESRSCGDTRALLSTPLVNAKRASEHRARRSS